MLHIVKKYYSIFNGLRRSLALSTATLLIVLITIFCNAISSTHHLINYLVIFLAKVSHCPLQTFFCYLSKGSEIERLSRLWTNWNTQPTLSFVIPAMIANIEYCCVANCERACAGQFTPPPQKKEKNLKRYHKSAGTYKHTRCVVSLHSVQNMQFRAAWGSGLGGVDF